MLINPLGKRIPSSWWLAHRLRWAKITSPEASLIVSDGTQQVPAALVAALTTATSTNTRLRSSAPLIGWLQQLHQVPNQKSTCGIFRHSLSQHPSSRHLTTVIAIMKMVAKLRVQNVHATECSAMSPHWDQALTSWLTSSARAGSREDVWLENQLEVAALVLNAAHIARVRAAAQVRDCSNELKELCSSSQLGQRVYGGLLSQLCFDEYVLGLDEIVESLIDGDIDEDAIAEAYHAAELQAAK